MQKSWVRWLKEGDANTKNFHNSVKSNMAKNIIHYLYDEHNQKISQVDQIKVLVEHYYSNLLGTVNQDVRPLSVDQFKTLHSFIVIAALQPSWSQYQHQRKSGLLCLLFLETKLWAPTGSQPNSTPLVGTWLDLISLPL